MPAVLPLLGLAAAAGYLLIRSSRVAAVDQDDDSTLEEDDDVSDFDGVDVYEELVEILEDSLGWPYWWSKGSPSTPWSQGREGVDCSGYVQMVLVRLGALSPSAPDRNAYNLAMQSEPVAVGEQRVGDWAYYPGHAMVVVGPPGPDGHSPVAGASGGGRGDEGGNPDARVKLFRSALYNSEFVTYCRVKA